MPKRKRTDEEEIEKLLAALHHEIHHALKQAKGHERQRQAKRLRDSKSTPEKKQRIQNEIVVLKSLDLHQTAHAHMCSALLRFKVISESPKLPPEIKAGVAKPDLTEEEKTALHNVTSALFARPEVRSATEKAIAGVCKALGVEVPEKKKGRVRDQGKDGEDKGKKEKDAATVKRTEETHSTKPKPKVKEDDDKKLATANGAPAKDGEDSEEDIDEIADKEEQALARLDALLGSSEEDEDSDEDEIPLTKTRIDQDLDPMEITSGEEDNEEADEYDMDLDPMDITSDEESDNEEDDASDSEPEDQDDAKVESGSFQGFSDAHSDSPSDSDSDSDSSAALSPPRKKKTAAKLTAATGANSTFLPTLMGGYISDSNSSASDLDLAPATRKNRRGQRARQAIWEKKFKEQAKHLKEGGNNKRDAGWDLKRGAVEGVAGKPWKQGIRNPLAGGKDEGASAEAGQGVQGSGDVKSARGGGDIRASGRVKKDVKGAGRPMNRKERRAAGIKGPVEATQAQGPGKGSGGGAFGGRPAAPAPKKRDDEGTLHPSWEARKKAKEMLETAPYQGKKITFD